MTRDWLAAVSVYTRPRLLLILALGFASGLPLALTGATLEQIGTDPGTRAVCRTMMLEAQAIGGKLGVRFAIDVEKRIDGAVAVGAHKTSMLQDFEKGRPMEIDALVTVVAELGRIVEEPTPAIDMVLALVQQKAELAGLYRRA